MCEGVTLENFGQKKTNFWKKPISGQKIPLVVKSNCLSVCIFEFSDLALCAYSICKSIPFRFTSPMRVYPPFLYLSASDPGIPNHQYNPTKTSNPNQYTINCALHSTMTTDSFYCDPNAFPAIEFSPQDQKQPRQHQHHHHQARHEKNILPSTGPAPAAKTKSSKLEIDAEDAKIIEKINYEPVRYLHNGPFSRIYVVKDEDGREFIAKVESRHEIKKTLGLEARIYQTCGHESGYARVYRCAEMAGTRAIIMQKLGTDLSRIRRTLPNERLSTADALKISLTTFCRIWKLHEHGWLHRDIKPSNFVIGMPPADSEVYIVDFGLARPITNQQRPDGTCPMVGTLPYMPLCSHYKIDYQPKDDLESWYYMCVMLFTGTLPWLHLLESPGMVGDYKRYFRNLRPHVGLPQLFGAIFETILNAGNRVNHHRIWALLKSANADLGDEKLIEPCAWMRDPNIVVRALQLPPAY